METKKNTAGSIPVQAGMPAVTVDTPAFADAANNWIGLMFEAIKPNADHVKMATALCDSRASFIAHINAHTAQAVAADCQAKQHAIQQAQQWAMEARTQRGTVLDILRHFGCPEEDWHALELIKAAAPQQHAQAAQPNKQYGLAAYAQANADSIVNGNAQAALSDDLDLIRACVEGYPASPARNTALATIRKVIASQQPAASGNVESIARAMAIHAGWSHWDDAKHCGDTLSGNDPDDEREFYRELARIGMATPAIQQEELRQALIELSGTQRKMIEANAELAAIRLKESAIQQEGAALDIEPLKYALNQIARLYEYNENASTSQQAQMLYDARCIARAALAAPAPVQPAPTADSLETGERDARPYTGGYAQPIYP